MFDLPELLNRASDMFKGSNFEDVVGTDIADRRSEFGVSEYGLNDTQFGDIQSLLEGVGVDPSALTDGQLRQLLASVKENGSLEGVDLSHYFDQARN